MDVSPESKLNQQVHLSYQSFAGSSQSADGSSPSDFTCDFNKNQDLSHLPMEVPLNQLVSGSPNVLDQTLSALKDTDEDGSSQDTLIPVCAASLTFAIGATLALILHIYLVERPMFVKGVLVSDHERCTALGQKVLHDGGSSVDAAITAALCLGVVHPHASGVGGGGVMMVHDIRKNETKVINFQGTTPKTLQGEMLLNVSELKAGLHVGVPGMLRGLQQAHSLYGRLLWEDVVNRAADVAKTGFNVSISLAEAISKVKGEQLSQLFRDTFLPSGQALPSGSFLRMPGLAGVLQAGLLDFYDGNVSQEIVTEVQANGGVLSREDLRHYSVQVEQPVESLYDEFIVKVPPPPSAGTMLISVLKRLEGFHLSENNNTENQTDQQIAEALKAALSVAGESGDPKYNSSGAHLLSHMLSKSQAEVPHQRISGSTVHSLQTELIAGQVVVMGPDDLMVSVACSLNRPFGSRIVTQSGVVLNSLILDFSWTNNTKEQLLNNKINRARPGKMPVSSLMPTIVVPAQHKCGIYMALSSAGGRQGLSVITQVLIRAQDLHNERNGSLSLRRLHPQPQPDSLIVDPEFPEEGVQFLDGRGHKVQRVKTNSAVQGVLRSKDTITAITPPQFSDSFYNFIDLIDSHKGGS